MNISPIATTGCSSRSGGISLLAWAMSCDRDDGEAPRLQRWVVHALEGEGQSRRAGGTPVVPVLGLQDILEAIAHWKEFDIHIRVLGHKGDDLGRFDLSALQRASLL